METSEVADSPVVCVHALVEHEHTFVQRQNICAPSLEHRHIRAVVIKVLSDVMTTVASADHNHFLALDVHFGCLLMLTAVVDLALELRLVGERRDKGLPGMARAEDDVFGAKSPALAVPSDVHRPVTLHIIKAGAGQARLRPHVQLHQGDICLEPVTQLVLRCELRPILGEREVGQVSKLRGIVGDEGLSEVNI